MRTYMSWSFIRIGQIAHAAGEFLKEKLFKIEDNRQQIGADNSNNSSHLILLIQFLIESEVSIF